MVVRNTTASSSAPQEQQRGTTLKASGKERAACQVQCGDFKVFVLLPPRKHSACGAETAKLEELRIVFGILLLLLAACRQPGTNEENQQEERPRETEKQGQDTTSPAKAASQAQRGDFETEHISKGSTRCLACCSWLLFPSRRIGRDALKTMQRKR